MKKTIITTLAAVALTSSLVTPGTAQAARAGTGEVRQSRACSEGSSVKLKARPDDGRLEVEAEVDSDVSGQSWTWRLRHNGNGAGHGTQQTGGASGSFSIERRTGNAAGKDTLRFRATHAGEVCVVSVSL
jgi:hypothetical protein